MLLVVVGVAGGVRVVAEVAVVAVVMVVAGEASSKRSNRTSSRKGSKTNTQKPYGRTQCKPQQVSEHTLHRRTPNHKADCRVRGH